MNSTLVFIVSVLCLLLICLAILQVIQALYEKYFYKSLTRRIRDYLKASIPGSVWYEQTGSEDPRLSVRTQGLSQSCRMVFVPGGLEKDAPRAHDLRISIKASYPTRVSIERRSFLPSELFFGLCFRLGGVLGTQQDRRVYADDRFFNFLFVSRTDDAELGRALLGDPIFRKKIQTLLRGRCRRIVIQNDEITLSYLFRRFRERPRLVDFQAIVKGLTEIPSLSSWQRQVRDAA